MATNTQTVGERIRTYRENLEMTPETLAEKSGVAVGVIDSIEKGEVLPALGVLTKISRALGQRLGTFMDDQFKMDPIVTRAEELEAAKVASEGTNAHGYASHSLAIGKPDRHMDPFRIELAPNAPEFISSHEGEELIIVLSGEVELTYGPDKTVLKAGDTAYYNSVVKHQVKAHGDKPASIYGIVYMPF